MTKTDWLEKIRNDKNWVFVFETGEVAAMFPEWPFEHHLQLFCATHGLSSRVVKGHYLFTRALPQSIVEDMTLRMGKGESLNVANSMA
jgi:hypothetical protein